EVAAELQQLGGAPHRLNSNIRHIREEGFEIEPELVRQRGRPFFREVLLFIAFFSFRKRYRSGHKPPTNELLIEASRCERTGGKIPGNAKIAQKRAWDFENTLHCLQPFFPAGNTQLVHEKCPVHWMHAPENEQLIQLGSRPSKDRRID